MREINKRPSKNRYGKELIAFAPDFGAMRQMANVTRGEDTLRNSLLPLEGAKEEVTHLANLYHGTAYFAEDASEQRFISEAPHAKILHLATHATVDHERPAYSRLFFDQKQTDSLRDGDLYAFELYSMNLQAELVTLSACNTGAGKYQEGEGVMSLGYSFAYAGCPNIVMSLWPVADRPASQIMVDFYERLKNGKDKATALHEAKLQYLQQADALSANPFFWGSFVFIGDNRPIDFDHHLIGLLKYLVAGILILGLGLTVFYVKKTKFGNK